jgi:carbon starvation protein
MPGMSAVKLVLWAYLAILGAVALAFVTGLVNPQEKVNGLWLLVAAACIYVLAFRFYGRWIPRRVVELNDQRVTPAMRSKDGVEYWPVGEGVIRV